MDIWYYVFFKTPKTVYNMNNETFRLYLITVFQNWLIYCNKCTTLTQDINNGPKLNVSPSEWG